MQKDEMTSRINIFCLFKIRDRENTHIVYLREKKGVITPRNWRRLRKFISVYKKGLPFRKKSTKDYRINLTNKLNSHINEDEAYKGRHKHGQEGVFTY